MPHLTRPRRLPFAATLLLLGLALGPVVAATPAASGCIQPLATPTRTLEATAQQAFRDQRYPAAYGRFARLVDAGHAPSAEMALFMLINGPALFGSDWTASDKQQACWNAQLVARARVRVALHATLSGD